MKCTICPKLGDKEYATQKTGWEENDSHLPEAASALIAVKEISRGSSRSQEVKRCPICSTFYLYISDYEYLAGGTEDSQELRRLSADEAQTLLQ